MTNPTPVAWMVHTGEIWNTQVSPYNDERGTPLFTLAQLNQARAGVLREIATHEFFNGLYISDAMTTHLINKLRHMAAEIEGEK